MLQRVYECCIASGANAVYVATCDQSIEKVARAFGAQVIITSDAHTSGTERLIEATQQLKLPDDQIVVNVQGDEPQMPPEAIRQVAMLTPTDGMATLMEPASVEEIADPNVVKVVCDAQGHALYFSRSAIPHTANSHHADQHTQSATWMRHLGIYAYRVRMLKQWRSWKPCDMERIERLEQLRPLYHGATILIAPACKSVPAGVDNESDLARVRAQCQTQE